MEAWRKVSINHGFEEIDGPTFEHLDLYKVKSGEGIVNELFSFTRAGGEKDYALRPEFTPTLARMYAAKAASLPKPTKWFTAGPFFRAERPQRGRLREFLQWNCDVIGDPLPNADIEVVDVCKQLLRFLGLTSESVKIRINDRRLVQAMLQRAGIAEQKQVGFLNYLDGRGKRTDDENAKLLSELEIARGAEMDFDGLSRALQQAHDTGAFDAQSLGLPEFALEPLHEVIRTINQEDGSNWCVFDLNVVRGLAYYTGVVFEVIVDGERAVAGGGRYDNLVELFGGPPTPAVGFGMGDVVLSLVLRDKGLMPEEDELMGMAGQSPDVFVISNGTPEADQHFPSVVSDLRRSERGTKESPEVVGLHVRRSYKATKNVGKLLQDAVKARARFVVIIESATEATIKDLKTGVQDQARTAIGRLSEVLHERLVGRSR
jgi:histidyl-tRNA synthetase